LLIVIAIIGILAAIAIPQFNQYKIRGYDAHSKRALKDIHLLCNAYWLDTDSTQGCDLPIIKDATYGFNQNTGLVATLSPSPLDNFCAFAKHISSPNTYSIDSASLISEGDCSGAGGSVQTASAPEPVAEESVQATQSITTWCGMEVCCKKRWNGFECSDGGSAHRSDNNIGCSPKGFSYGASGRSRTCRGPCGGSSESPSSTPCYDTEEDRAERYPPWDRCTSVQSSTNYNDRKWRETNCTCDMHYTGVRRCYAKTQ
jgi:type IV pilus assembly protein PilA